jgi:hypothetical protein
LDEDHLCYSAPDIEFGVDPEEIQKRQKIVAWDDLALNAGVSDSIVNWVLPWWTPSPQSLFLTLTPRIAYNALKKNLGISPLEIASFP